MNNMPGGTWIAMEGIDEKEDIPLICIGYKYNKKTLDDKGNRDHRKMGTT